MEWNGNKLRQRVEDSGFTQESFSKKVGVTRTTYTAWITGEVPKGIHLIKIWDVLGLEPDALFNPGQPSVRAIPSHRKRGVAKVTGETNQAATALAESFAGLFEDTDIPVLQLVATQRTPEAAVKLAIELRKLMGIGDGHTPPTALHVFELLKKLGIYVIFTRFPENIKDYAFYTHIKGNRVVFANTATNELDLIFPLIHEAVHAVRNVCPEDGAAWDQAEDVFCDRVAGLVQFPDGYVADVQAALRFCPSGRYMDAMKEYAERHQHVIYGVVLRLVENDVLSKPKNMSPYHIADAALRKKHGTLRDLLLAKGHISTFLNNLQTFSPLWFALLQRQARGMTIGRLAECLDLSYADAKSVIDDLTVAPSGTRTIKV